MKRIIVLVLISLSMRCASAQSLPEIRNVLQIEQGRAGHINPDNTVRPLVELLRFFSEQKRTGLGFVTVRPEYLRQADASQSFSSVLIVPDVETQGSEFFGLLLFALKQRLSTPFPPVRRCDHGPDSSQCCAQAPSVECVRGYEGTSAIPELARVGFLTLVAQLLAHDLAQFSTEIPKASLRNKLMKADAVYLLWADTKDWNNGRVTATMLEPELLVRLVATWESLLPSVGEIVQVSLPSEIRCANEALVAAAKTPLSNPVAISLGTAVPARSYSGTASSSLDLKFTSKSFVLQSRASNSPPVGNGNASLARSVREAALPLMSFSCMGTEAERLFAAQYSNLNSARSSVFFFYSLFLLGRWNELQQATP